MKKVLVAMSGGVDSAVAAYLIKSMGVDCIGGTMHLSSPEISSEHSCCTERDIEDARLVCERLGIEHRVFDFSGDFKEKVIDPFISAYENGRTPNPCVECNRRLKFERLFLEAEKLGCDTVVTGHYVRSRFNESSGRYELLRGLDETKDQSYVLYSLTQAQLKHAYFPLGGYKKSEIREIAEREGLINANKPDSQDICFIPDGKYAEFIKRQTGREYPEGDFVDSDGNILGKHKGIIKYTVGQKKGLGLVLDPPLFVSKIDSESNRITLVRSEKLFTRELFADDVNLISVDEVREPMRVSAKIRYRHKDEPATLYPPENGILRLVFDEPQRAITAGQSAVIYCGDSIVGGGKIISRPPEGGCKA